MPATSSQYQFDFKPNTQPDSRRIGPELCCLHRQEVGFPGRLNELRDPPTTVWLRGRNLEHPWVAVVGSRAADSAALTTAEEIAATLASQGLGTLSGGALGVDGAAHRGALAAGGLTAAVMAGGVDRPNPQRHLGLFSALLEQGGFLLSERPLGALPFASAFPRRNQLLAALSLAVIVVCARLASGTLITAREALALGRPVLVVTGAWQDARRDGNAALLELDGCWPISSPAGLIRRLEQCRVVGPASRAPSLSTIGSLAVPPAAPRSSDPLWQALADGPHCVETLVSRTGHSVPQVLARLTELELAGQVRALGQGRYGRAS